MEFCNFHRLLVCFRTLKFYDFVSKVLLNIYNNYKPLVFTMFFVCPCRSPMGEEQPRSEHQDRMVSGPFWTRSYGAVSAEKVRDNRRNGHSTFALRLEGMVCTDTKRRFHVEAELGPVRTHRHFGAQHAVFHLLDKRLLRSSSSGT